MKGPKGHFIGTILCHKDYVKWLRMIHEVRNSGINFDLDKILDWNKGIGKWFVYKFK
jgi:hypothetical protein